jgi:hypothetical protein
MSVIVRAVLLLPVVAGCAGPMGTLRPGPSVPVSQAASEVEPLLVTSFDGSYRTTIRPTGIGAGGNLQTTNWCDTPGQPIVTVTNGQLTYAVPHPNVPGNPTPVFEATMSTDGSFTGQVNSGSMSGHVVGSHMEGKMDGSGCLYAFTGDRV